ncbi:MAG: 50S ribosomal protein L6 [Anaerolineae bacterium]|nr:50S ribosomal protein L6 [Anaerolineae bacterium]
MSRIGRMPIAIPKGVEVTIEPGNLVTVKGPKGVLRRNLPADMQIAIEDGQIVVRRPSDARHHRALHGLTRALLANMVRGVSEGFRKDLEIVGVGYRAELQGQKLVLSLGYSHPVEVEPPEGITFEVERGGRKFSVLGIDKELVGEVAAKIRAKRPPEPYKGKGIRYVGEYVRMKAGKGGKIG